MPEEEIDDLGVDLSNKSIELFEEGKDLEAVNLQLEVIEEFIKMLIRERARYLGNNNTEIHKLADEGDLQTRINNLIKLCGNDFSHLCSDLQEWRKRRNRLSHRKASFKNFEELNEFAKETWLLGTKIIYIFMKNIANIPNIE